MPARYTYRAWRGRASRWFGNPGPAASGEPLEIGDTRRPSASVLRISRDAVTRRFKQLLRGAGLPEVRFHDLRHGAASMLLAQGVPSRVVMDVLGHSQIGVTMNTYTHVMPSLVDEAADAIDRALGVAAEK